MNTLKCPHCADGVMSELVHGKPVRHGRRSIQVEGLRRYQCSICQGDLVSRAQMKANDARIDEALAQEVEASVDAAMLKALRERFDLTQKQASKLFSAGDSAFAKWESGQSAMSGPAALLVRCAYDVRGVMEHLASLQGMRLTADHQSAVTLDVDDVQWESVLTVAVHNLRGAASYAAAKCVANVVVSKASQESLEIDDEAEWQQASTLQTNHATQSSSIARLFH